MDTVGPPVPISPHPHPLAAAPSYSWWLSLLPWTPIAAAHSFCSPWMKAQASAPPLGFLQSQQHVEPLQPRKFR
uniref:Uncharacterized protein n=1 Tax=Zea mays TaxID=4577 RepID=A0A804PKX4_MAIZE